MILQEIIIEFSNSLKKKVCVYIYKWYSHSISYSVLLALVECKCGVGVLHGAFVLLWELSY